MTPLDNIPFLFLQRLLGSKLGSSLRRPSPIGLIHDDLLNFQPQMPDTASANLLHNREKCTTARQSRVTISK
jgi:hypothetical protein